MHLRTSLGHKQVAAFYCNPTPYAAALIRITHNLRTTAQKQQKKQPKKPRQFQDYNYIVHRMAWAVAVVIGMLRTTLIALRDSEEKRWTPSTRLSYQKSQLLQPHPCPYYGVDVTRQNKSNAAEPNPTQSKPNRQTQIPQT